MPWQKSYETGIESVDIQHRRLFDRLENTKALLNLKEYSAKDREKIKETILDLENYVATHFTLEERLMEDNNYPKLKEHIAEHERFSEKIQGILLKLDEILSQDDQKIHEFLKDLTDFLEKWLKGHILGSDFAYVPHLKTVH